jgi:hypothetical protein
MTLIISHAGKGCAIGFREHRYHYEPQKYRFHHLIEGSAGSHGMATREPETRRGGVEGAQWE